MTRPPMPPIPPGPEQPAVPVPEPLPVPEPPEPFQARGMSRWRCTRGHDTLLAGLTIGSRSFCMACLVEAFDKLDISEVTRVES
jgi:hypothetical protein